VMPNAIMWHWIKDNYPNLLGQSIIPAWMQESR
jgi:hypothetical protein